MHRSGVGSFRGCKLVAAVTLASPGEIVQLVRAAPCTGRGLICSTAYGLEEKSAGHRQYSQRFSARPATSRLVSAAAI